MELVTIFLVALVEWVVGVLSARTIAKGRVWISAVVVFFEQLLGFYVFFAFVENLNNWQLVIAYSLGASIGTGVTVYFTRNLKEGNDEKRSIS